MCDEILRKVFDSNPISICELPQSKSEFYNSFVASSEVECFQIFKRTLGQSSNPEWFKSRKYRISASKAHSIGNARKSETILKYFFGSVMDNKNLMCGREIEDAARKKYAEMVGVSRVLFSGNVVSKVKPWLCSSPDGLIVKNGSIICLEINCPISFSNGLINVPYLKDNCLKKPILITHSAKYKCFAAIQL